MKVVLAGAYGNLGAEIFKALLKAGHEVVAADMMERDLGVTGNFTFKKIDVTNPETDELFSDSIVSSYDLYDANVVKKEYKAEIKGTDSI